MSKKESVLDNAIGDAKYVVGSFAYDKKGMLISKGVNSFIKTHPEQKKCASAVGLYHNIYLHAEISALVRAKNLLIL